MVILASIKKPVFPKIATRFNISQGDPNLALFPYVIAITNADETLTQTKGSVQTTTAVSGTLTHNVPAGKFWIVKHINSSRANAGDISVNLDIGGVQYFLKTDAAATAQAIYPLNIKLQYGDHIDAVFGGGTSGQLNSYIVYEEGDLYQG